MTTTTMVLDRQPDPIHTAVVDKQEYGLKATYYFQGKPYFYWLRLKDSDQQELLRLLQPLIAAGILNKDDASSVLHLNTLTAKDIRIPSEYHPQIKKIIEIAGRILNPSNPTEYADRQMPIFHSDARGDLKARTCFQDLSARMQRLFQLKNRDEIHDRLINSNHPVLPKHYFQAWLFERMIAASKKKIATMKTSLPMPSSNATPDEKKAYSDSQAALDRLDAYLSEINPFIMNHSLLSQDIPIPDQIDRLKTILEKGRDPLSENERIAIIDIALLSTTDSKNYVKQAHEQCIFTARDPNEFPFLRLIMDDNNDSFFNHPHIHQAINGLCLDQQEKLKQFLTTFRTQAKTFYDKCRPTEDRTTWAQKIATAQATSQTDAQFSDLFLGVV